MILSRVNELRDENRCAFHKKSRRSFKWLLKLYGFSYLVHFYFVGFIILKLHAQPICNEMENLKNEDITCDVIRDILDTHNRIRQSIAKGSINAQPPAANMRELYWDSELAAGAQMWANKCTFAHNHPKEREVERFEVGQNIGLIRSRRNNTVKLEFSKHIYNWFDEHEVYQFGPIDNEILQVAGHYTQLVWANTYLVGCGYSQYKSNDTVFQFFVCHYGPAGNEIDESPYTVGNHSCDHHLKTSSEYPNLCGLENPPASCPESNDKIHSDENLASIGYRFFNNIRDNVQQENKNNNITNNKRRQHSLHGKYIYIPIKNFVMYNKIVILT